MDGCNSLFTVFSDSKSQKHDVGLGVVLQLPQHWDNRAAAGRRTWWCSSATTIWKKSSRLRSSTNSGWTNQSRGRQTLKLGEENQTLLYLYLWGLGTATRARWSRCRGEERKTFGRLRTSWWGANGNERLRNGVIITTEKVRCRIWCGFGVFWARCTVALQWTRGRRNTTSWKRTGKYTVVGKDFNLWLKWIALWAECLRDDSWEWITVKKSEHAKSWKS